MRTIALSSIAITCFVLAASAIRDNAGAQQIYQSPQELAKNSSLIVTGKVTDIHSYWNTKHTKIFTDIGVAVEETYAGEKRSLVTVIQLGGTVGTVKMTVDGVASWREGEEVFLFLEPGTGGKYQTLGLAQGKFNITRDPATKEAFVEMPGIEASPVLKTPSGAAPQEAQKASRIPLRQFVAKSIAPTK